MDWLGWKDVPKPTGWVQEEGSHEMKVLICGGRDWKDSLAIFAKIREQNDGTHFIHGGCPTGADFLANKLAEGMGYPITVYHANWALNGRAAGPIRNQQMLDWGKPDKVIAFWDGVSNGTWDMIRRAKAAGVPVEIVWQKGCEPKQGTLL